MKVNIIVNITCSRLSNIVFPVSVYTYRWPEVFGEILAEILHIVMIELLILPQKYNQLIFQIFHLLVAGFRPYHQGSIPSRIFQSMKLKLLFLRLVMYKSFGKVMSS